LVVSFEDRFDFLHAVSTLIIKLSCSFSGLGPHSLDGAASAKSPEAQYIT